MVAQQQPLTDGQSAITMSTHGNRQAVKFFDESTSEKYQRHCGLRRQSGVLLECDIVSLIGIR